MSPGDRPPGSHAGTPIRRGRLHPGAGWIPLRKTGRNVSAVCKAWCLGGVATTNLVPSLAADSCALTGNRFGRSVSRGILDCPNHGAQKLEIEKAVHGDRTLGSAAQFNRSVSSMRPQRHVKFRHFVEGRHGG